MIQMTDTLTLEQVEHLRQTLPVKSFADLVPSIDVDEIVQTQEQVMNGVEFFIPEEK